MTNEKTEFQKKHLPTGARHDCDIRLRRLYHEQGFSDPGLATHLKIKGIEVDYSTLCRIAWEQTYAVSGWQMSDEMASSLLRQLENPNEDWSNAVLPSDFGIETRRDYRIKHAGLNDLELRLSGVVRKLLEISEGSDGDADLGSNVYVDSESLMIQAHNDGIDYKFWLSTHEESKQYFVSDVEVEGAGTGVDLKWSGDEDDILSILEDCLSGEGVWGDLKAVAWECSK